VLPRIAIADKFLRTRVEILLTDLDALSECRGGWLIQDLDSSAWTRIHFNSK
jgi:hypothetical protein